MDSPQLILELKKIIPGFEPLKVVPAAPDEMTIEVLPDFFKPVNVALHKILPSPVMMLFAADERERSGNFFLRSVFVEYRKSRWIVVKTALPAGNPVYPSLAPEIYSAALFEREIREMYGVLAQGNPDNRRLNLHPEVWPEGDFPLRKDFRKDGKGGFADYGFTRVEGEGIFEVPVGPVHAGIIGPGHFRFSSAGEPIVNLEIRLGFTHRGVEKLFEGKTLAQAMGIAERVSGDSSFAHGTAFAAAAEKICGMTLSPQALYLRGVFLELERLYNHINDIGGMALDVGFSFPSAHAAIIKESLLCLNRELTGSRYLKGVNAAGGLKLAWDKDKTGILLKRLAAVEKDFLSLSRTLDSSVSFMDRVDSTGVLRQRTALDLGVTGVAARASGISTDLRKYFPGIWRDAGFRISLETSGDVLARLKVRIGEFIESLRLIREFAAKLKDRENAYAEPAAKAGSGLGYTEGWRGPVLYWLECDDNGLIRRCKAVDPSFRNWQGLSYAVLGNIIPDFPLCNKSFDLSYSGNDL